MNASLTRLLLRVLAQLPVQGPQAQIAKSIKLLFISCDFFCNLQNIFIKHIHGRFVVSKICMKQMSL